MLNENFSVIFKHRAGVFWLRYLNGFFIYRLFHSVAAKQHDKARSFTGLVFCGGSRDFPSCRIITITHLQWAVLLFQTTCFNKLVSFVWHPGDNRDISKKAAGVQPDPERNSENSIRAWAQTPYFAMYGFCKKVMNECFKRLLNIL